MRKFLLSLLLAAPLIAETGWQAGVAKSPITPKEPIWLAGFGARVKPSEGVRQDIWVRALALKGPSGDPAVLVTLDLVAIDRATAEELANRCKAQFGIPRDRIAFNVSHTHSGPVAGLQPIPLHDHTTAEQRAAIDRYTPVMMKTAVDTVGAAIRNLSPATISFEQGLAGIAVNRRRVLRRNLPGPVDHDVPTLAVRDPSGRLRALVVGYACHATALNDYLVSNDWPGYAIEAIEKANAGATALFVQGCGADANPLPRAGEELARKRGEILAAAVEQVLAAKMRPVAGPLRTVFETVDLPLRDAPSREDLRKLVEDPRPYVSSPARYLARMLERDGRFPDRVPYPVQVWTFGDSLRIVFLGGEVVADYSLRLKARHGFENTWVAGYSNHVLAYIPSRRVLEEGGYEGGEAMLYFGLPGRFGAAVEEIIVEKVGDLVERTKK